MATVLTNTYTLSKIYCLDQNLIREFVKPHKGSFLIVGGTVNVYVSNLRDKPANLAAMFLELAATAGTLAMETMPRWIAFESVAGAPVVNSNFDVRE